MIDIIHHPADADLARHLRQRLAHAEADAALVVLSAAAVDDAQVQAQLERALDEGRRIVPLLAEGGQLPELIEHLEPLDAQDLAAVEAHLASEDGSAPLRVHTASLRSTNRRTALVVLFFALIMFLAALYGVGVLGLQYPHEEYDEVHERVVATRDAFIEGALPRSTEEALAFPVTVEAAATALRPLLAATATSRAGGQAG